VFSTQLDQTHARESEDEEGSHGSTPVDDESNLGNEEGGRERAQEPRRCEEGIEGGGGAVPASEQTLIRRP